LKACETEGRDRPKYRANSFPLTALTWTEILVQCFARFELLAVDQEGVRPAELVAVFVKVPE
jgi:hypothetical protein